MTDEKLLQELTSHYSAWTQDVTTRLTRKYGWNDITDAYYGILPSDWPFTAHTTDPRIRTSLIEKNARLLNSKLRGRLVPRENGDIIGARINNALLDYQWDKADEGGSMQVKMSVCDMDTRLYQSKFALVKWRVEYDDEGKVTFESNEMTPLDIRDCGMDFSASHVKDAKWFQHRSWEFLEDLDSQVDFNGKPLFKNLDTIKSNIESQKNGVGSVTSSKKDEYTSRVKEIKGLEDRLGTDVAFPVIELVTEYRADRWITFSPDHNVILRDIPNPYKHGKIPIAQLRYYSLQDDPLGESEVESIIPLWRAIQATLCGYMDEVILKMRPPLKIIEGAARLETIVYNPEAQWLMTRPDAVTEMQSSGQAVQYFQATYVALISAFNTAMGMMSQGTSNLDATSPDKTATEVKSSMVQQNARDQKNQTDLAEFIKDIMMMWLSNNKQFIFSDPSKKEYLLRIIGKENFAYFQQAGLDQMQLPPEAATMIKDIIDQNPNTSQGELDQMVEAGKQPRFPVWTNPKEKNPAKYTFKPKMSVNDTGDVADITMVPEDMDGTYDYIADVKSMAVGANDELIRGRQTAIATLTGNPVILQLLAGEGYKPKIMELMSQSFEDLGLSDAERFFEKLQPSGIMNSNGQTSQAGIPQNIGAQAGSPQMGSVQPTQQNPGVQGVSQAPTGASAGQQMA